jgi:Methyltransferase domain
MGDGPGQSKQRSREEIEQAFAYCDSLLPAYFSAFEKCRIRIEGLKFLEIGPGPEFGVQLILASMGANITVADPYLAVWDPEFHPRVYQLLSEKWPDASGELKKAIAGQSHEATSLAMVREPAEALVSIPDESIDFIYSNAVLEHVVDMRRVAHELARVSKDGAWSAHQIDWRDHRDFSRPLEHLVLGEDEYRKAADAANWKYEFGNRLRSIEFGACFEDAGFEIVDRQPNMLAEPDYLKDVLPRLRANRFSSYSNWPDDDLARISGRMFVRKAAEEQIPRLKSNAEDIFSLVNSVKTPISADGRQAGKDKVAARGTQDDRPSKGARGVFARILGGRERR